MTSILLSLFIRYKLFLYRRAIRELRIRVTASSTYWPLATTAIPRPTSPPSQRTEEAYVHWIRRYILFHGKRYPTDLGAAEVTAFLTWLAIEKSVAASTQNQHSVP